ncbi:hypothetical protein O3M35_013109 [Rhynocoris fuscipes]|uniref:Cystatin domain-containing protein n=1 Tax=Rhynocoris fuscipes TaxID=488301 RepID=A0AAW1CGR4_9HEMI
MASFSLIATFLLFVAVSSQYYVNAKICPGCIYDDKPTPAVKRELLKVVQLQNADIDVVKIVSLKKQIVAGIKYIVEFEAKSRSSKEDKLCSTTYVVTPWKGKRFNVLSFSCSNK